MLSLYRIQPNNTNKRTKKTSSTNFDNTSHRKHDLKRPQLTSNDLKRSSKNVKKTGKKIKTKNNVKGGSVYENIEITDQNSDDILHNNNS